MKRKVPLRDQLLRNCADIHTDDGQDPKLYFRKGRRRAANRKTLQLCRQVAEALQLLLGGELADEVLRDLEVLTVTPAPDSSQLLVCVGPATGARLPDAAIVASRLNSAAGRIRAEIASVVTRRRAPRLLLQYVDRIRQEEQL